MDNITPTSFWQKNKLTVKAFFIAFLVLALLIPTFFITYLVTERKERKEEVTKEISNKWSAAQTITGPFLTVPYTQKDSSIKCLYILPEALHINADISTAIRYRSIYKVPVYTAAPFQMEGKFSNTQLTDIAIDPASIHWDKAKLCIGIADPRGLKDPSIRWNGKDLSLLQGLPEHSLVQEGVSVPLTLDSNFMNGENDFSIKFSIQGSEKLYCLPLGNTTTIHFNSGWTNPAFDGKYLPDSENVSSKGFTADWNISPFNKNFPKVFTPGSIDPAIIKDSSLGVILLSPFDAYAQTMRSIKYAILIITLTFFAYFFSEIFQRKPIHTLQYILIGMALVIFYILLLSLSEYVNFSLAYLLASSATIGLLAWYTKSIFSRWGTSVLLALLLSLLYGFVYVLIQMEDKALLFGSIGLFALLATAMYLSRKVDWFKMDGVGLAV